MCPGSVNRGAAVFQSVWGEKKDEATQAIICTILSASNTFAVEISLERLFNGGAGGRRGTRRSLRKVGENLGWRRREETLLYGVQCFFFSWRIVGLLRGFRSSNDSVFACAHGDCECLRLDACAGFTERMELALWNCE